MKNVLKLLVAGMMLVAGSFVSMAQRRADQMKEAVKLTDEQYAKVVALYKEESEAMQKMMQSTDRRQQMDREAMQKQREEQEAKLKAILTEEQYKTWTEAQQNMRRRGPGGPGGQGGGRPQR